MLHKSQQVFFVQKPRARADRHNKRLSASAAHTRGGAHSSPNNCRVHHEWHQSNDDAPPPPPPGAADDRPFVDGKNHLDFGLLEEGGSGGGGGD